MTPRRIAQAGAAVLALLLVLSLAACAPVARVVLLPEAGGTPTALEVRSASGSVLLSRPYQSAELSRTGELSLVQVGADEVARRHPSLVGLMPAAETRQVLNFTSGTSNLTPESERLLPAIAAAVAQRPGGEVIVVGHTDTTGTADGNDALSLQRAEAVRQMLVERGVPRERTEARGRGMRELLVPTQAQVDEPRNRRVDIIIR